MPCHGSGGFGALYSRVLRGSAPLPAEQARQPSTTQHGQAVGGQFEEPGLKSRQEPAHVRAGQALRAEVGDLLTILVVPPEPRRIPAGAKTASLGPACSTRWRGLMFRKTSSDRHAASVNVARRLAGALTTNVHRVR